MFVTILRNENGDTLPIYNGNNEVPPGQYEIYVYEPFLTSGEKMHKAFISTITITPETELYRIVFYYFEGKVETGLAHLGLTDSKWEQYVNSKGDRLKRYLGWESSEVSRMM